MQQNILINSEVEAGVQRLVELYEQLSPERLNSLHTCYAPHAHFKDPFNDVHGLESIQKVFSHMFMTVDRPRFVVTEQLIQGQRAFLVWEFHFCMRRWRKGVPQCIRGGTLLHLNAQGLVLGHRDYWDTAEELYEKLPLLGQFMAWLRRAASATSSSKP